MCDGKTLSYYTTDKDKKPNAILPLEYCSVQDGGSSETWNSPRIYVTDGTIGTVYCLSAENGSEVTEWLNVLRCAIARVQTQSGGSADLELVPENTRRKTIRLPQSFERSPRGRSRRNSSGALGKVKKMQTSLALENELSKSLEILEELWSEKTKFQLQAVADDVRVLLYTHPVTCQLYAKGSTVVDASPDIVMQLLADTSKRGEWDVQFSDSKVVASLGASTEMVHLSGKRSFGAPLFLYDASPVVSAGFGVLVAVLVCCFIKLDALLATAVGGALGVLFTTLDCRLFFRPRDALILQHVRDQSDGSFVIVERSVEHTLKPVVGGIVRAEFMAGGFLIQPLEVTNFSNPSVQCLVTYIANIDMKGWMSPCSRKHVLLERVKHLSHIRAFVVQSQILGCYDEDSIGSDSQVDPYDHGDDEEEEECEWRPSLWNYGMSVVSTGGLKLTDKDMIKKQKGVLSEVLRNFGASILEGKSAVSLSLPVRIFEPRSMLERLLDTWLYAPIFLSKAAVATDPVERFKLVVCFAFAGLHHGIGQLKPFNPILGETYQAELCDGASVYCEHTSHHPPISNFYIVGPGYKISGYLILSGAFKGNAVTQEQTGPINVSFDDGTVVTYNMPTMRSGGFIFGDRIVELLGLMEFKDESNQLKCSLQFNPDEKKGMGGMFTTSKTPSDFCRGELFSQGASICNVSGSWLNQIEFADKTYWEIDRDPCLPAKRPKTVPLLPSDCKFREDLVYLKQEDTAASQEWKLKLEKLQRADRVLRKANQKANHWSTTQ